MSERPNVLLISTDHWPASLLGVADHPAIQTPTLDELARVAPASPTAMPNAPSAFPPAAR
ncbi:MAG: hypothetical protein R2932_53345 [Caldilineaceae bacterium]